MPKGQYTRKPRVVEAADDAHMEEIARQLIADPTEAARLAAEADAPEPAVFVNPDMDYVRRKLAPKVAADPNATDEMRAAVGLPPAEPAHKTFDSWMAEDEDDVPLPANGRVSQMVRAFGGSVCNGWHDVTWLPANDGKAIEVTLVTPFGTSVLTKDAGNWREADIAAALEQMTADLRV